MGCLIVLVLSGLAMGFLFGVLPVLFAVLAVSVAAMAVKTLVWDWWN